MSFPENSEGSQGLKRYQQNQQGYQSDFFDIDDIIATQQRIPCRFEQQVYNLGIYHVHF